MIHSISNYAEKFLEGIEWLCSPFKADSWSRGYRSIQSAQISSTGDCLQMGEKSFSLDKEKNH